MKAEDPDDIRIQSARRFAEAHDSEFSHALQVVRNSLQLFDPLGKLHSLGARERILLHASALMHDTGYENAPAEHHKGSREQILAAELEGFTHQERLMMACIARYHRGALPKPSHKVYDELDERNQAIVDKLAAILRVADGLDRSHMSSVQSLRAEHRGHTVHVYVKQAELNRNDIAGGMRKNDLFEKTFGVRLVIESE